ncbi:demethoxyubiquinone hydroxylase family protein [Sphingomonas sp.]|uniref:demethoxyubiquinone hydroxylase family protein n=1 Tax=Sphingomonas sp. TaxID=28214 RepID=UPI0031D77801
MTDAHGTTPLGARLRAGETLADRIMKVDHAGEHCAICIYTAQRWIARWRAPAMVAELGEFLTHERRHRALFAAQLAARGRRRCRSYHLCALGGFGLGIATGLLGSRAIAATTVAIERVVLAHLTQQLAEIGESDPAASSTIRQIVAEEQEHHDRSAARLDRRGAFEQIIDHVVAISTEAIIWLGMRL